MDRGAIEFARRLGRLRRRRVALGFVFLLLPLALWAYFAAPWSSSARTGLLLGWVAVYSFSTMRLTWSKCPQCLALFFLAKPGFRANPLRTSCGNCGCPL